METRTVVRTLVLNGHDEALLLVRSLSDEYRPGKLDLPGGSVEFGEDNVQAAARELQEETSIAVPPAELVEVCHRTIAESDRRITRFLYYVQLQTAQVAVSHEHRSYSWLPLAQAATALDHHFYSAAIRYGVAHHLFTGSASSNHESALPIKT